MTPSLLDAAGRRRSPATMPGYLCGRAPKNKGRHFPADPPRVEEIIAVMRAAGGSTHGLRVRGLIAVLWRAGLRISEALALTESDVDPRRGSVLVRHGKGDKRREAGMDDWGFEHLTPLAGATRGTAGGAVVLRNRRINARQSLVMHRRACRATPTCGRGRGSSPLRSSPAPTRACRRAGPRGHRRESHPAPTRAYRPRHHLDLPPGN
jgi:integrase